VNSAYTKWLKAKAKAASAKVFSAEIPDSSDPAKPVVSKKIPARPDLVTVEPKKIPAKPIPAKIHETSK
jgi:hypothetical protein